MCGNYVTRPASTPAAKPVTTPVTPTKESPMSKITLNQSDKDALAAARRAGTTRKHIWARVRSQFNIPSSIKLGVTTESQLFVKDTEPRQFLLADSRGRYSHAAPDVVAPTPAASVGVQTSSSVPTPALDQGTAKASRFVTATPKAEPADLGWAAVRVATLAGALSGSQCVDEDDHVELTSLPDGFPTDAPADALVFDADAGLVYFRT
jgi:hypothetical protein